MFVLFNYSMVPGFWILVILYYLYRAFKAVNWGNVFTLKPQGPRMDYLLAPVLFAFLPIFEGDANEVVPWYYSIFKYDVNAYDGLAKKKRMAYEINAARLVGKKLDPALYGLDDKSFNQILCDLKSVLINEPTNAIEEALNNVKAIL